jgi:hypothetical protein
MEIKRAVFEKGVEIRLVANRWELSSAPPCEKATFSTFQAAVAALSPLRPLLITEKRNFGGDLTLLLRPNGKDLFGLCVYELMNRPLDVDTLYPVWQLQYLLGAVGYHCHRLAELYAQIAIKYNEITQIPGYSGKSDIALFNDQAEAYYEFDAFLGAARRSYDALRYLLWPRFGNTQGSTPRSLEALLKTKNHIPEQLLKRLKASWEERGVLLTQYRDCIHHYVPMDFGLASAIISRHPSGAWTTKIRIPDNPEARSKKQFKYSLDRDALTYAWELSDEILEVAMITVDTVLPEKKDA